MIIAMFLLSTTYEASREAPVRYTTVYEANGVKVRNSPNSVVLRRNASLRRGDRSKSDGLVSSKLGSDTGALPVADQAFAYPGSGRVMVSRPDGSVREASLEEREAAIDEVRSALSDAKDMLDSVR